MINKLSIFNFESHKKTILDLHSGLTVFVGETDRGKSGVFRAFDWCRENEPSGEAMKPLYWEGDTKVITEFEEGTKITRFRSKSKNEYQINEEEPINAGTGVPEEVQQIFNMDTINYQSQVDRSFLMFDTPGERGRVLNRLAGLDKIDSTLKSASSDLSKIKKEKETQEKDIKKFTSDLEEFNDLPFLLEAIVEVEKLDESIEKTEDTIFAINSLLSKRRGILSKMRDLNFLDGLKIKLRDAQAKQVSISQSSSRISSIKALLKRHSQTNSVLLPKSEIEILSSLSTRLTSSLEIRKEINLKKIALNDLLSDLNEIRIEEEKNQKILESLRKQIPTVCPECGSILKEGK